MITNELHQALPAIFIGREKINERVKLYQNGKHKVLTEALHQKGMLKEDTKSIWYTKEHIEILLEEIRYWKADGLRIYLGEYEEAALAPGQLCLLMVLTRKTADGQSREDIKLEDEPSYAQRVQKGQARSIHLSSDDNGRPREYNYGSPCPPICFEGEPGFPED